MMSGVGGTGMFQFGGLASGLDTKKIISSLVALERRPIKLMEDAKALKKMQKQSFSDLTTKLNSLMDSLNDIRKTDNFLQFKASPGEEGFFSASASSSALKGTWDISVEELASVQRNLSSTYANPSAVLPPSAGTIQIDLGSVDTGPIDVSGSLSDIASSINTGCQNAGIGVSASVIDTGNGHVLQLSSEEGGLDNSFTITKTSGSGAEITSLVADLNTNKTAAKDSRVAINGVTITRSTNTITDAISGVTLNLTKVHDFVNGSSAPYKSTSLTIDTDASAIADKIKAFITEYNGVLTFMEEKTKVNDEGEAEGNLVGDFTLNTIRRQLRAMIGGVVDTGNTAYAMMAFAGVNSDRNGALTLTQSELEEALADDEQAIEKLFSKDGEGIADRMYDLVDNFTDTVDGLLVNRKKGLDRLMNDLDRRIERSEERLESYEARLVKQFAGYETLMSQYQSQGQAMGFGMS